MLVATSPAGPATVVVDGLRHVLDGVVLGCGGTIVQSVDLDPADVGVFAVLVVLEHDDADEETAQRVSVLATAGTDNGDIDPALRSVELHRVERDGEVRGRAGSDLDLGRCVTLIKLVVQEESQSANLNALDEVDVQAMRLRTVGPYV